MKTINIVAVLALITLALGVGCKKEEVTIKAPEKVVDLKNLKHVSNTAPVVEIDTSKHLPTCDGWVVPGILCEGCKKPKPVGL